MPSADTDTPPEAKRLLAVWRDAGRDRWFRQDPEFDEALRREWLPTVERAAGGELDGWAGTVEGALALVLLLDQLPRNLYRKDPRTWATDPQALRVAEGALARGFDRDVDPELRSFLYLPFMHAEDLPAQDRSVAIYEGLGNADDLKWARHHRDIVARFGRFPHRNAVLGRDSTPDEIAFLEAEPWGT